MPAMPWHRLFSAQHPEAKQRFPFKAKSHYENPGEKVSLACRAHSSFLLPLNKLLVTFKNRTKMKKQDQKCCQRHFILHSLLGAAPYPSPGTNPGQELGGVELRSQGSVREPGVGGSADSLKMQSLSFLKPWRDGLTTAIHEQLCCMMQWVWACILIPYTVSLPMLMFFSFPTLSCVRVHSGFVVGCAGMWHFGLKAEHCPWLKQHVGAAQSSPDSYWTCVVLKAKRNARILSFPTTLLLQMRLIPIFLHPVQINKDVEFSKGDFKVTAAFKASVLAPIRGEKTVDRCWK